MKERIMRLELENKKMKSILESQQRDDSTSEKISDLQEKLDIAQRLNTKYLQVFMSRINYSFSRILNLLRKK